MAPLLISIMAFVIGAVFFSYFYMRDGLLLNKKNDIADGVAVDYLKAIARSNTVEKEFDEYFLSQKCPPNIEVCMSKIREITMKKLKDLSGI